MPQNKLVSLSNLTAGDNHHPSELVSSWLAYMLLLCLPCGCPPGSAAVLPQIYTKETVYLLKSSRTDLSPGFDGQYNSGLNLKYKDILFWPRAKGLLGCWFLNADCQKDPCSNYGLLYQQVLRDSSTVT